MSFEHPFLPWNIVMTVLMFAVSKDLKSLSIIDKTLVIRFKMNDIPSCKNGDTYITINGIMNKLTCKSWKYYNGNETFDFVLSSNDSISKLEIIFGKGKYDISDIELYEVSNSFFDENEFKDLSNYMEDSEKKSWF